jgi:ABC-2 type transport system ATP-binding protein
MLEVKNLNFSIRKKCIIEDFSHEFQPGVYGLLGENGAGKTTLMRCLTGVYSLKMEAIFYEGVALSKSKKYSELMSYLPQQFGLFKDLTVKEMMLMMASLKGVNVKNNATTVEDCVALVNLSGKLHDKVKSLSGGMIRRLGIAQTLLNDPKVIIFDEPTAGLDIEERLRFKNIVSEISKGRIIIISTHIATDIEALCDEVIVMKDKGILFTGSCEAIKNQAQGKTYVLLQHELSNIMGHYHIQSYFEKKSQKFIKIITDDASNLTGATPVEPTIEDGYICLLKDI